MERLVVTLDGDLGAGGEPLVDLLLRELGGLIALAPLSLAVLAALVVVVVRLVEELLEVGGHVPVVEERVLLEADVDEGGLEVVLEVLDASAEDAAHEALLVGMLDHVLFEAPVFEDGDAGLELFDVDDDFSLDLLLLEEANDLVDDGLDDGCHLFSFLEWISDRW